MKKLILLLSLFAATNLFAQTSEENEEEYSEKGFKKENILIGTAINIGAGFGNYGNSFNLGLNPEVGYGITKWLDAGLTFNINYQTQNLEDVYGYGYKYRATNYGGGVFARIWPVNFLHVYVAQESNWIKAKYIVPNGGGTYKETFKAPSLLAGIGYGNHVRGGGYNYFTLMIDLMDNPESPYRDQNNDIIPTIRVGFGTYLKSKKR